MIPILQPPFKYWHCHNCQEAARTVDDKIPYHYCGKLALGLQIPLVPKGVASKIEVVERQDYIGGEVVQFDENGRPVMSVVTTRDEGQDCAVYPATAQGSVRE